MTLLIGAIILVINLAWIALNRPELLPTAPNDESATVRFPVLLLSSAGAGFAALLLAWLTEVSETFGFGLIVVATLGTAAALIDAASRRLPLLLTVALLLEVAIVVISGAFFGAPSWDGVWGALIGLALFVALMMAGARGGQIGGGDVVLGAGLGLWVGAACASSADPGWSSLQWAGIALLVSLGLGVGFAADNGIGRNATFAFGPALVAGTLGTTVVAYYFVA